jgi:hypothetical protein
MFDFRNAVIEPRIVLAYNIPVSSWSIEALKSNSLKLSPRSMFNMSDVAVLIKGKP